MSKLIEKLKKLSQAAPPPMGFRTSKAEEVGGKMLILGRVKIDSAATPTKINTGADAVLFYDDKAETAAKDFQKMAKAAGDVPWGVYLDEGGGGIASLVEAGCDFIVFSPTTKINDLPQNEKIGKVLQVESSMDDGLLRAINDLPADAVLVTDTLENDETLTMHRLMIYRHLANFISRPLIAPVPANINETELKALQAAEIDGVMAEGDNLKELRKNIGKLPARSAKKRGRGAVLLPHVREETATAPPDEEEEEDE
jgi:hypothetical protein